MTTDDAAGLWFTLQAAASVLRKEEEEEAGAAGSPVGAASRDGVCGAGGAVDGVGRKCAMYLDFVKLIYVEQTVIYSIIF